MKIEVKDEVLKEYQISKEFSLKLEDGTELTVNKWERVNSWEYDNDLDWKFDDKSKKIFDKFSEEQQEEIYKFIGNLKLQGDKKNSISEKNYQAIATAIWRSGFIKDKNKIRRQAKADILRLTAICLATELKQDDPNFNREKFMEACRLE